MLVFSVFTASIKLRRSASGHFDCLSLPHRPQLISELARCHRATFCTRRDFFLVAFNAIGPIVSIAIGVVVTGEVLATN